MDEREENVRTEGLTPFVPFAFQFVLNRNRDVELAKLRKLVDEVHLESEEHTHILKKKHTEVMADFQEQIDMLTKAKSR